MSDKVFTETQGRMAMDPLFAAAVYSDPRLALRGLELTASEVAALYPSRRPLRIREELVARWGIGGEAICAGGAGLVAIAVVALAAYLLKEPLLFPSLGASVLLIFQAPLSQSATPRNTLLGHMVGLLVGLSALWLFGLLETPSALQAGFTWPRVEATATAVAVTSAVLVALKISHPPAGATTLIVALGLISGGRAALYIPIGVVMVTALCWFINRGLGTPVPLWSPK